MRRRTRRMLRPKGRTARARRGMLRASPRLRLRNRTARRVRRSRHQRRRCRPPRLLRSGTARRGAILTDAAGDANRTQTRLQALAALGLLRSPRSSKMIAAAMTEPDLDVRTAAAVAAGQTKDRNLTTNIRNMLDDKEPQVAFAAAMTLWKMNDKSGED